MSSLSEAQVRTMEMRAKIWKILEKNPRLEIAAIAKKAGITASHARHHVTYLEKQGCVKRTFDMHNTRKAYFYFEVTSLKYEFTRYEQGVKPVKAEKTKENIPITTPKSHIRVVRLLDNPLPPPPKSSRGAMAFYRGIGSSMGDME